MDGGGSARSPSRSPAAPLVLLVAVALAGCLSGPAGSPFEETGGQPPTWEEGDWWRYRFEGALPTSWMAGFNVTGANPTHVGEDRSRMILDRSATFIVQDAPESRSRFFEHAVVTDDLKSGMGSDLFGLEMTGGWSIASGQPGNDATPTLLNWTLHDGKSWSIDYAGKTLHITAHRLEDQGPGVYRMEGHLPDGGKALTYTYDPSVGWFTEIEILEPGADSTDDRVRMSIRLEDTGKGYSGVVYESRTMSVGVCGGATDTPRGDFCEQASRIHEEGQDAVWNEVLFGTDGDGHVVGSRNTTTVVHDTDTGLPETWFRETCPCETRRLAWTDTDEPGLYSWRVDMGHTSEAWLRFTQISACWDVWEVQDGRFSRLENCPDPFRSGDATASDGLDAARWRTTVGGS